jgi:hypothetical protein
MMMVAVRRVRVMARSLVIPALVMSGGFQMVLGCVLVMLGSLPMMICGLLGHVTSCGRILAASCNGLDTSPSPPSNRISLRCYLALA